MDRSKHQQPLQVEINVKGTRVTRPISCADSITLGSGAAAMVRLPAGPALQAVVNVCEDGTFLVLDLGTADITLAGKRTTRARVHQGEAFTVGDATIRIRAAACPQKQAVGPLEADNTEDPLAFLMRTSDEVPRSGAALNGTVLEVAAVWGVIVMDVQHYHRDHREVTIGTAVGHRWRLLGLPISWVPEHFSRVAWMAAPMLSSVQQERRDDFFAPGAQQHVLIRQDHGQLVLRFRPEWGGFVDTGGERVALRTMVAAGKTTRDGPDHLLVLPEGSSAAVDVGGVIFVTREVRPGRRVFTPLGAQVDYPFAGIMAFMGAAFMMLTMVLLTTPPPSEAAILEVPERIAEVFMQQVQP
jgi:hypothetical protein